MNKKNVYPDELDQVCRKVGEFIDYWGFKEIEGRIWAHILLSDTPLCASDIMERTGISKALVSISISRLVDYDVIQECDYKVGKTQFYEVNINVTGVIKNVLRKRELKLISEIASSVELLKNIPQEELQHISTTRIEFLLKMVKMAKSMLRGIIFAEKGIKSFFFGTAPAIK